MSWNGCTKLLDIFREHAKLNLVYKKKIAGRTIQKFGEKSFGKNSFGKKSVRRKGFGKKSVRRKGFGKMSFGKKVFGELS